MASISFLARPLLVVAACWASTFAPATFAAVRNTLPADRLLLGHRDGVMEVAFFPQGDRLVSGSYDRTIKLWDVATGKLIRTIEGHTGPVRSVAVSFDGKWIASASEDHTVRVWDAATGDQIAQLEGHPQGRCVRFCPDGTLISGGNDGVRIWDVKKEKLLWNVATNGMSIRALVVSQDGSRFAFICVDGFTRVFDIGTHKKVIQTGGARVFPDAIGLSPDGKTVFSEGLFGSDILRDLRFGRMDLSTKELSSMPGEMTRPRAFAMSADGQFAVTAVKEFTLWNTATWKPVAQFDPHAIEEGTLHCVTISADGKRLAAAGGGYFSAPGTWTSGNENVIAIYEVPQSKAALKLGAVAGDISWEVIPAVVKTRDGKSVQLGDYTLYEDASQFGITKSIGKDTDLIASQHAILLRGRKGELEEIAAGTDTKYSDVDYDGKNIWVADLNDGVLVFDPVTKREVARLGVRQGLPQEIRLFRIHALDVNKIIATASGKEDVPWCGILTRDTDRSNVIKVHSLVEDGKLPPDWPGKFRPQFITEPPHDEGQHRTVLIACAAEGRGQATLRVDVDKMSVSTYNVAAALPSPAAAAATENPRAVNNHRPEWMLSEPYWLTPTIALLADGSPRTLKMGSTCFDSADTKSLGIMIDLGTTHGVLESDGRLYLAGKRWLRLDPLLGKFRDLGPGLRVEGNLVDEHVRYFNSAHLGMAAISAADGCFYRFSVDTTHPLAIRATADVPHGQELPAEGVAEYDGKKLIVFCGEAAITIDDKAKVTDLAKSAHWRVPCIERQERIETIKRREWSARAMGITITPRQNGMFNAAFTSHPVKADAQRFRSSYDAWASAAEGPAKEKAMKDILAEVRAYGQKRSESQKAQLADMQAALAPEQWARLAAD